MEIRTPTAITEPIFSGYLEPEQKELRSGEATRAEIGRPEWWFLSDVVGASWKPPQGNEVYLLVRLSFSLAPPKNHQVEEATFQANMRRYDAGPEPVTFDLFPREVLEESKIDLKLKLEPSLKLKEIEASLASVEANIHIPKVEPVLTTSGIGGANPQWLFRKHRRHPIVGSRMVYAIVGYPVTAQRMRLQMGLTASVHSRFGTWLLKTPSTAEAQLMWTIP